MMKLSYVKDILFDLLNESDELDLADIEMDDAKDAFLITGKDGSRFEILCRSVEET